MSETTGISWADHTWNPWLGCAKVSPGCKNCYAQTWLTGKMGRAETWGKTGTRNRTTTWPQVRAWNRKAAADGVRRRVFPSLQDFFEARDAAQLEVMEDAFELIRECPALDFLILTKRPGNIAGCLPEDWGPDGWPNVWLGVSVESGEDSCICGASGRPVRERMEVLSQVPAVVRFVSYEPAIGPLDIRPMLGYDPVHEKNEKRRGCLRCGYQWRAPDRRSGTGMEDGLSAKGSREIHLSTDLREDAKSGEDDSPGLPSGQGHARRREVSGRSSPPGMASLPGRDSGRVDDQPQERRPERQPAGKLGGDDLLREHEAQDDAWELQPVRGEEPPMPPKRCPRCGNADTAIVRGESYLTRGGVWSELRTRLGDLSESPPLLDLLIYGGESGAGRRPEGSPGDEKRWARKVRDECRSAGIAFWHKQSACFKPGQGVELDGEIIQELPTPRRADPLPAKGQGLLFDLVRQGAP